MKKINKIILAGLVAASSLSAISYEYPQLYKDTKIMGMGGAGIAAGGQTTSIFYNSAGLSQIPKEYGWEVDLFNFGLSINKNIADFGKDLSDVSGTDNEKNKQVLDLVEKNLGNNNHLSANLALLTIGRKFDGVAIGLVPFGGAYLNMKPHSGFGSEGVVETSGLVYGGVAFGISKDIKDVEVGDYILNNFTVGGGIKSVTYKGWNKALTISELVDNKDDMGEYFTDKIAKDGSSAVLDLGMQYDIMPDVKAGLSIQNIGGIGDKETVEIPMTVGVGTAYTKRFNRVWLNQVTVAADYVDLFRNYEQDKDGLKRIRLGVTGNLIDGWAGTLGLQAGMYQGHYTFGVDTRLFFMKIAYTTYAEEIGAYS
ncbi:MAG: hypothetical protein OIF32_12670, partial [Campylobacterales bacterium]|nr:hypothetical protein [Campylobacterales bacterium]